MESALSDVTVDCGKMAYPYKRTGLTTKALLLKGQRPWKTCACRVVISSISGSAKI